MIVVMANGFAQQPPQPVGERQAVKMKSDLSLTDEQFAKVQAINHQFRQEHSQVLADSTLAREEILVARKRLMEKRDSDINAILTDEQRLKWASMKKPQRRKIPPRATIEDNMEAMKKALDLTGEQAEKISKINAKMIGRTRSYRMDTTMTRENRVAAIKVIAEERRAEVRKILTKEQYDKFLVFEEQQRRGGRPAVRP